MVNEFALRHLSRRMRHLSRFCG